MAQSDQEIKKSQKIAIKSILWTIGVLGILASAFSIISSGFELINFTGIISGISLLFLGFVTDKLE